MPRMTIEIPDLVYDRMTAYQRERKPHLSLKDVIVEAVDAVVSDHERITANGTQVDQNALADPACIERLRG